MKTPHRAFLAAFAVLAFPLGAPATASASESENLSRRLFDFTPTGEGNPVLACIDHSTTIPLSEFAAYVRAEKQSTLSDTSTLTEKRAALDDLINEYLFVDACHRRGIVASPAFKKQMDATQTMILVDFLTTQLMRETPGAKGDPTVTLGEKLFADASIDISNEAFAVVKSAARTIARLDATWLGDPSDPDAARQGRLGAFVSQLPDATLARYEDKSVTVRQLLVIYAGLPAPRPDIQSEGGLVSFLKPFIIPELLAIEARRRGIDQDPLFAQRILQNQNALLRFRVQGEIDRAANEALTGSTLEADLANWYETHRPHYPAPADPATPGTSVVAQLRPQLLADYSVALRERLLAARAAALRAERDIEIDESILREFHPR